jgi:MinD superfamily P-loop ATPase
MEAKITIAVASGKGGTGKTTVSANLARAAAEAGYKATYLDCDVEEPNGHLFLKPHLERRYPVTIPVPLVDEQKCTGCGACGEICQFSAILCINKTVLTFEKMCHGCGGCKLVCPTGAITEQGREIGIIEEGQAGGLGFLHGRLNVGEAMSPPLIRAVRSAGQKSGGLVIVDVPPGTSCPVIAALRGANYVLLVTEPTPFGLNDLGLAIDVLKELGSTTGAIIAAVFITALTAALQSFPAIRMILYALILVIVMIYRPQGLMGNKELSIKIFGRIWSGRNEPDGNK